MNIKQPHIPPVSPLQCSPVAAAACLSAERRCTRHTLYNHHPEGRVWPSVDPGQVSHRQFQWKSRDWLK